MLKILSAALVAATLACAGSANATTYVVNPTIRDDYYFGPMRQWLDPQFGPPGDASTFIFTPTGLITDTSFTFRLYGASLTALTLSGATPGATVVLDKTALGTIENDGTFQLTSAVNFDSRPYEYKFFHIRVGKPETDGGIAFTTSFKIDHAEITGFIPSPVPEPATWAMMIIGFGAVGSMIRTSRRRNAFSAA